MNEVKLRYKSASFIKLVETQLRLSFKAEFKYKINLALTLIYFLTDFFIIIGIGLFIDYSTNLEIRNTVKFLILGVFLKDQMNSIVSSFYQTIRNGYWSSQIEFLNLFPNGRLAFLVGDLLVKYFFSLFKLIIMIILSFLFGVLPDIKNPSLMVLTFFFFLPTLIGIGLICVSSFNLLNARKTSPVVGFFTLMITIFSNAIIRIDSLTKVFGSFVIFLFEINPFYHFVEIIRNFNTDIIVFSNLFTHFLAVFLFNILFSLIGFNLYRKSVRDADLYGSLSRWN